MSVEVIIDNEYATLWYYPDAGIVHHKWKKYIYGEHFRAVLNRGAEIFEQRGATKWLSDDRLNSALPKDDGIWALGVWNPRVRAAGWKDWAVLFPDKKVGQTNLNYFMRESNVQGITAEAFDDVDEALNWLRSVDEAEKRPE